MHIRSWGGGQTGGRGEVGESHDLSIRKKGKLFESCMAMPSHLTCIIFLECIPRNLHENSYYELNRIIS